MTDLPDDVQREFEVRPGHQMFSTCVIRRRDIPRMRPPHADPIIGRVLKAIVYWLRALDAKPGEAGCLVCGSKFLLPGVQCEAYAVTLPTAKMHKTGRTAVLVAGVCADCSSRSDDELIEIARERWVPHSTMAQEGRA